MRQYLSACMDPFITLLEVHKLMYFLTACGEPIQKLSFQKGTYGPYSENLRHVLNVTEGYFTQGFGDGEDSPEKPIELLPKGVEQAETFLRDHSQTRSSCQFDCRIRNALRHGTVGDSTLGCDLRGREKCRRSDNVGPSME